MTRTLLGVTLDVDDTGRGGIIETSMGDEPIALGDRIPDLPIFDENSRRYLHELCQDSFVAFYFTDARRHPKVPVGDDTPGLSHYIVSRWDAPENTGLRPNSLFDSGELVTNRFGLSQDTIVLVRPDGHVASIIDWDPQDPAQSRAAVEAYEAIVRPKTKE